MTAARLRAAVVAATTAASLAAVGALPRDASACSLRPPASISVAHPGVVSFVGRAGADTVRAGPGAVAYALEDGHFGRPVRGGPVYGQVVTVGRLSVTTAPALRAAVRAAGGRVVLVPWGYGADCRTLPWTGSARWMPDAARGLFEGRLRDREHWAGGVPTLDVFGPQFVPYAGTTASLGGRIVRPRAAGAAPLLTPDELLDLRATLPTAREVRARLDTAFAPLRAWAAAHPALAAREPARQLLRDAEWTLADLHFRRRPVPLAGTYRVTVWTADAAGAGAGDSSTFYVRTEDRPSGPAGSSHTWPGMYVLACATADEATLPVVRRADECTPGAAASAQGYFAFGDSAWTDSAGRRVRAGSVDVAFGDSAFRVRHRRLADDRSWDGARGRATDDPRRLLPGLFTESPDGRVTFAWVLGPADAPRLRISAVRVSATTLQRRPDPP